MLTGHLSLPAGAFNTFIDFYNGSHWRVLVSHDDGRISVLDYERMTKAEAVAISAEMNIRLAVYNGLTS